MLRLFAPVCLLLLGFLLTLSQNGHILRGENDFAQIYLAGTYAGTRRLLEPSFLAAQQMETLGVAVPGGGAAGPLPGFAYLAWPLAQLPYRTAYWMFQALSMAALWAAIWIVRVWAPDAAWWVGISLPLLATLMSGQDTILVLAALMMAARRFEQGEEFEAGVWLAVCLVKFPLFVLFPLVLILHRVWRTLAGAALGAAVVVGLSYVAAGPEWIARYVAMLSRADTHGTLSMMQTVESLVGGSGTAAWWLRGVAVVAVAVIGARSASWRLAWAAALLAGRIVVPYANLSDLVLVLGAYLIAAPDLPWLSRRGLQFVLLPILPACAYLPEPWPRLLPAAILLILLTLMVEVAWRPTGADPAEDDGALPLPQGA